MAASKRDRFESPPPLRGRSIRDPPSLARRATAGFSPPKRISAKAEADREGGSFDRIAIRLPPSLTLPLKGGGDSKRSRLLAAIVPSTAPPLG